MSVCKNCIYYNACGSTRRTVECNGKTTKLNIQRFGGRGATSEGKRTSSNTKSSTIMNDKARSYITQWANTKQATKESEEAFRKEINKLSYNKVLELAQIMDEADLISYNSNGAFAINTALDNVIEVGKKKNANKWSTDFGKWRQYK